MMDIVRQKLANFKVIFDLRIFCFYFIQQQKYILYYATLMINSEIGSKVHIDFVTAQSSMHLQILGTEPCWFNCERTDLTV